MKSLFIVYGALWLFGDVAFVRRRPWAWTAMLVAVIGSLRYAPVGTVSAFQIALLLTIRS